MILQRALAKKKSKWSFTCKSILGSIFSFDGRTTTSLEISNQVGFPSVLFAKLFIFPFFLFSGMEAQRMNLPSNETLEQIMAFAAGIRLNIT